MRTFFILIISVLITVSAGTLIRGRGRQGKINLVSPLVAGTNISTASFFDTSHFENNPNWQVFVNNYSGYKIKHPSDVSLKNYHNGDIGLQKNNSIDLYITEGKIQENDDLNTFVESVIDKKIENQENDFYLAKTISPIAIGFTTALTYSSIESGKNFTYYFIPKVADKYILITNKTPEGNNQEYIISEEIIYSFEKI
jgi:hypothetical protein